MRSTIRPPRGQRAVPAEAEPAYGGGVLPQRLARHQAASPRRRVIAAISITGHAGRLDLDLDRLAPVVRTSALSPSRELSHATADGTLVLSSHDLPAAPA